MRSITDIAIFVNKHKWFLMSMDLPGRAAQVPERTQEQHIGQHIQHAVGICPHNSQKQLRKHINPISQLNRNWLRELILCHISGHITWDCCTLGSQINYTDLPVSWNLIFIIIISTIKSQFCACYEQNCVPFPKIHMLESQLSSSSECNCIWR